jgi:hypothetical protein
MSLIYRTDGPWGTGKGSNLTAPEIDENFYTLLLRIIDIEENPIDPVSIADITMAGNQITIHMTNGGTYGPFNVPVATFTWMENWEAGFTYQPWDVFVVPGNGQYLVVGTYEAPTEFDPDDASLRLMFRVPDQAIIPVINVDTPGVFSLLPSHMGTYIRFNTSATIAPPDASSDGAFPIGSVVVVYRNSSGDVQVGVPLGVTVNTPESLLLRRVGSSATLVKTANMTWDLTGDLEQVDV